MRFTLMHLSVLLCRRDDMPDSRRLDDARMPNAIRYHKFVKKSLILLHNPQPASTAMSIPRSQTVRLLCCCCCTSYFFASALRLGVSALWTARRREQASRGLVYDIVLTGTPDLGKVDVRIGSAAAKAGYTKRSHVVVKIPSHTACRFMQHGHTSLHIHTAAHRVRRENLLGARRY